MICGGVVISEDLNIVSTRHDPLNQVQQPGLRMDHEDASHTFANAPAVALRVITRVIQPETSLDANAIETRGSSGTFRTGVARFPGKSVGENEGEVQRVTGNMRGNRQHAPAFATRPGAAYHRRHVL